MWQDMFSFFFDLLKILGDSRIYLCKTFVCVKSDLFFDVKVNIY